MMMKSSFEGDDFFLDRLLVYFREQLPGKIISVKPIRNHVFLIETEDSPIIAKAFSSYRELALQQFFTSALKEGGFPYTYRFLHFNESYPSFYGKKYFAFLEYIEPDENKFSFSNEKDRLEGLDLLYLFHEKTEKIANGNRHLFVKDDLINKWRHRAGIFLNYLPVVKFFLQKEIIDELLSWANWSLKGMEKVSRHSGESRTVVLHGDLAPHNFLRGKDGNLFLIDFDLISIGSPLSDYLQYANRVLPHLGWSFSELEKMEKMKLFLEEKFFLYALAYPADIFREWNRLVREQQVGSGAKVRKVLDLTVGQFLERGKFFRQLKILVRERLPGKRGIFERK